MLGQGSAGAGAGAGASTGIGKRHRTTSLDLSGAEDGTSKGPGASPRPSASSATVTSPRALLRRRLLVLLCSLCTAMSYCDRVNMSVAILEMAKELGWDMQQRGAVLAAFFWGYIWSQIPGAFLARRYGGHAVLFVAALLWSLATLAVPVLARYSHAHVVWGRVALGVFEGALFPVVYHLFAARIPRDERSRALGSINFGVFGGAIFSFAASPYLIARFHWSFVFYFFGGLGLVWCALWAVFTRFDERDGTHSLPCAAPRLSAASSSSSSSNSLNAAGSSDSFSASSSSEGPQLGLLEQARLIVCHKVVLAIFAAHFSHNVGSFVMLSWLPTFFEEAFGFGGSSLGLTCLPYLAMAIAVSFTSTYADGFISRGEMALCDVRRISTVAGFLGAGTFMILIPTASGPAMGVFYMCVALACNGAGPVAGYEAAKLDVAAPDYVGRLQSISNTIAAFAGILGVPLVAMIKTSTGSWSAVFGAMGAVFYFAAFIFHKFGHYDGKVVPG